MAVRYRACASPTAYTVRMHAPRTTFGEVASWFQEGQVTMFQICSVHSVGGQPLKGLLPNAQAKNNMPFRTRSTGVNEMDVEGDYPLPLGEGRVRVSVFA